MAPQPEVARRVRGERLETTPIDALVPGDVIEVAPGEVFPTDGVVLDGEASCDESALTGESRPVPKAPGSAVAGGTCSIDGRLRVRVTEPAASSAAARIAALIEAARRERAPMERLADRVAAALVPLVLVVAAGAGAWWAVDAGVERGALVAIAVLVVACPCALGIATPVAVARGLALAARRGVVVRSAALLERAADAAHVVFDKTGTLTEPLPRLVAVRVMDGCSTEDELLARAAALEQGLAHPLARAIAAAAASRGLEPSSARDVRLVPGRGVRGEVAGEELFVGAPAPGDLAALGETDARDISTDARDTMLVVVRRGAR